MQTLKVRNPFAVLAIALPLGAAAWWLWSTSRAATRTPGYKVIRREGPVEIRDYPALTVVTAPMRYGRANRSFRKLFEYISGGNERLEKIAMTTPVLMNGEAGKQLMGFILPETTTVATAPVAIDRSITIESMDASRYAAMGFRGERSAENEERAKRALAQFAAAFELEAAGEPLVAYYDPPWTPLFLRRNEVLMPLAG